MAHASPLPIPQSFSQAQRATMTQQLLSALQRHATEPAVQAAGMSALLRLAGCTTCRQQISREQQDALGAAGAIPAALAALEALRAAAADGGGGSKAGASDGAAADDSAEAAAAAPTEQQQQLAAGISAGLQALYYLCAGHARNLQRLADAGGLQAVGAALAAARSEWPAEEHALLLLAALACREGACADEQAAAAAPIWAAAQAQVERRLVEVGRAAVWAMARVLQRLQAGVGAGPEAAQAVAELQLQGAAVALAMLQSCDKQVRCGWRVTERAHAGSALALRCVRCSTPPSPAQQLRSLARSPARLPSRAPHRRPGPQDDPLLKHCLDLLSVVAAAPRAGAGQQLPPGVAAALLSREAAAAVLVVAGKAAEPRTQAAALRTLYCLCRAGACGLTWQQLAAGGAVEDAELVTGATSVAAAVFAVASAASQAAAAGGRDGGAAASSPDQLSVQLYGLAAVGALLDAMDARSPAAAAALAAALAAEQLAAAQEAVAAACGALARSPHLLALVGAEPEGGESAEPAPFALDLADAGCHAGSWAEAPAWQHAAHAVRGVCRLLRCAPEGANTADREGFTLLHRCAAASVPDA